MSGPEAAASLFGSADSSSDPFATLGTEPSQEASDDLFGGDNPGATNDIDSITEHQAMANESFETGHSLPATENYGRTPKSHIPTHNTGASHGTYGTHQQWNETQSYYGADGISSDANKYVPPTSHGPYTPPRTNAYVSSPNYQPPAPQAAAFSHIGNQASIYDSHHVANPYTLPQPTNQSAHTPYAPVTSGKIAVTSQQLYALPPAPSHTSHTPVPKTNLAAAVPAPPAPTTTQISRPKVSNAYDPPFPVVSYNRRNVSGPAKYGQGHTTPVHSTHATYQPATPPPLPPPPPRAPAAPSISSTPPPLRAPAAPVSHPPPRPPSKSHDYGHAYVPPLAQHPPPSHHILIHDTSSILAGPPLYAPADPNSVPSASAPLPEPTESQGQREYSLTNDIQYDKEHTLTDESGSNFFDEINEESLPSSGPEPIVEQVQSVSVRTASSIPATTSLQLKPIELQSPDGSISSSPPNAILSPPPRTSTDSGRASSPRQSPRILSSSSPVHGFSHGGPRASPDLLRESLVREHTPRSKTASPNIDGSKNTVNTHAPPPKGSALRTKPASMNSSDKISTPGSTPGSSPNALHDRYAPRGSKISNVYGVERTGSPSSSSSRSSDSSQYNTKPQLSNYLPPVSESPFIPAVFSQESMPTAEDPYAPSQEMVKSTPSFGGYGQSPYAYTMDSSPSQEVITKPTITPYAPSPSLVGANDPLSRNSVRVPVVSFGFGGKIVTCFYDASSLSTGFDVALSPRTSTKVQVQSWKKLVPESALDSMVAFPGPLHADPGPPSTGLMKAGATTQAKTKKTSLLKYLSDRADEITQGLGYLHNGSVEKRAAEGKLVLVKLLRVMVENDGRLLGTPQLDSTVRAALVPRLEGLSTNDTGAHFTTTADVAGLLAETPFGATTASSGAAPISVTTLRGAALDKIEEFLLRGERRQAYHYALDEKLWAHAMVIASSIDKEAWKEVVNEFIRADLGVKGDSSFALPGRADPQAASVNGREGLRVAYSLFSGQGTTAVQELVPKNILARGNGRVPIPTPTLGQPTPRTPNFALPAAGTKIPTESLAKWAETVAMLLVSPSTPDASAALTSLGDQLLANGWLEAAHVCFLLSPQTSPVGGIGNPAARIVLLGSKNPANAPTFSRDFDTIIFTEILEYAMTTAPVPKGQEPNHGFPHLQAYRLIRAYGAAEAGDLGIASRYCEAITASLVRGSVYFTPTMLDQLKNLADRLSGVSHSDKPNSWMPGKISKPSLDTIGGWLEGRFTKLVTGESDSPASPQEDALKQDGVHGFTGPFAHYNTISSATSSARSSPAPTFVTPTYTLPPRTGSALSNRTPYSYGPAVDPARRKHSPGPMASPPQQAMSASAALPSFPSIETQLGNYNSGSASYSNAYSPGSDLQTPKPLLNHDGDYVGDDASVQEVTWWGSSADGSHNNSNGKTPTVARFEKVEEMHSGVDNDGLFSPMMNQSFAIGPQSGSAPLAATPVSRSRQSTSYAEDEEDDLGLGNNSKKKKEITKSEGDGEKEDKSAGGAAPAETEKKPDVSAQISGGWFSRWWGRKENTSGGPVKASLGEESSFYYDKELKRWVNKRAGAEALKVTPPPPPPRAQTASPGMSGGHNRSSTSTPTPPPPPSPSSLNTANGHGLGRPASAIDLTTSPPQSKPLMRVRSNLAPPGLDSAPPTPTGTRTIIGTGPPPPNRPKSSTSQKRNVRNRYVDVFAAEGGGNVA